MIIGGFNKHMERLNEILKELPREELTRINPELIKKYMGE